MPAATTRREARWSCRCFRSFEADGLRKPQCDNGGHLAPARIRARQPAWGNAVARVHPRGRPPESPGTPYVLSSTNEAPPITAMPCRPLRASRQDRAVDQLHPLSRRRYTSEHYRPAGTLHHMPSTAQVHALVAGEHRIGCRAYEVRREYPVPESHLRPTCSQACGAWPAANQGGPLRRHEKLRAGHGDLAPASHRKLGIPVPAVPRRDQPCLALHSYGVKPLGNSNHGR